VSTKINIDKFQEDLRTRRLGKTILFKREVDSTNMWAKELARLGAEEGTVAVAETQTSGRGRLSREWFSPRGGLWFSVILRPQLRITEALKLMFVAGLVVAETLHETYGLHVETKWPNDVLVNGKKICGILTEMSTTGEVVTFIVVGIGINANIVVKKDLPTEVGKSATSLENELGHKVLLGELLRKVLEAFETEYGLFVSGQYSSLLDKWKSYAKFLGRMVRVTDENESFAGLALDVDHDGALMMKREDGTIERILAGDVSVQVN
jgi:BirA family transcriptional regulator, biotin operon repressor / biotin---[acetyl-CoA-carboxylase] ligase